MLGRRLVSPAASFLLNSFGVDVATVTASHRTPRGDAVVVKADVLAALRQEAPPHLQGQEAPQRLQGQEAPQRLQGHGAPVAPQHDQGVQGHRHNLYDDAAVTTMRKVIASRLTEVKQSRPHFYASMDVDLDGVLAWRQELKALLGSAPSINDVVIKASALALRDVPGVNCRMEEDGRVVANESIDVAVAVATPTGLITPIVRDSDRKGVAQISAEMKELAGRARINKLKLDEFQGGSFAVSNLGMLGIDSFTAIISPPHAAILAVGSGRREFANAQLDVVNRLTVQMSCDRRVIDDHAAATFLQVFATYMARPGVLMSL